jgi:DNA helicase IV
MKRIKDLNQIIYIVYGAVGVGRTSFVLKSVTYLIERRVF